VRTALLLAILHLGAPAAWPCAPAPPPGHRVDVLAEQAVIVWDPASGTEHFIRRASFAADVPDFGFLVPTPKPPQLAEAADSIFEALDLAIQPEVVRRTRWQVEPTILCLAPFLMTRGARETTVGGPPQAAAVHVLEEKRVAGYDAAVLQADDAQALLGWLRDHGYDSRPELQAWLQPYVEKRWTITAFKIAAGEGQERVRTQPVRMSFAAERPLFPYREPADQQLSRQGARELRVYLVSPGRMEGAVGGDRAWPAEVLYAAPRQDIIGLLTGSGAAAPSGAWLTAFHDRSNPRPAVDDLFFAPSASTAKVVPPPIVIDEPTDIPLPLDVLALVAGGVVWWWRRRRRA
jgi:hypothetical protein